LLLGFVELTLKPSELLTLAGNDLFECLRPQLCDAAIGFCVLRGDEQPLLALLFGLPAGLADRALDLLCKPLGKCLRVLPQLRGFVLAGFQGDLAFLPALLERLLLLAVLSVAKTLLLVVLVLRLLPLERLPVLELFVLPLTLLLERLLVLARAALAFGRLRLPLDRKSVV
jgi:hypothetical protein